MARRETSITFTSHVLAALIVGGVLFFAFVVYLAVVVAQWFFTHPAVLVYAFLVLITLQAHWMVFALLKRRLSGEQRKER